MRTGTLLLGFGVLLAFVTAACGGDMEDGAGDAPPPEPASATNLEMTVWPEGEGAGDREAHLYTLTCAPPGGDHPNPMAACAALRELGAAAFDPVPDDVACTQIYGGPMEARVQGTVDGQPVDARLAYNDGCQIARWDALRAVVPLPDAGATG